MIFDRDGGVRNRVARGPGRYDMKRAIGLAGALLAIGLAAAATAEPVEALAARVRAREAAFAKTMADRDHTAFATFVSEEALFMGRTVLRGRLAVAEGWKPFFEGPKAPFSWQPDRVEVVASGTLAFSTGPVFDPEGKRTGTFNSTWRLEKDGEWRVVLDSGCPPCSCP
jgi:ketosteroid isomerase-like protein